MRKKGRGEIKALLAIAGIDLLILVCVYLWYLSTLK